MDTPGYRVVVKSYEKINRGNILRTLPKGDPEKIAKSLVELALKTKESGSTFVIDLEGEVSRLSKNSGC